MRRIKQSRLRKWIGFLENDFCFLKISCIFVENAQIMSKLIEEWRPVVGYEGLYEVSDWGNIKSLNYNHTGKPKLMTKCKDSDGYYNLSLWKNGKRKNKKIHVAVAEAWIPNPENKKEVGHTKTLENGLEDKTANEVWNLQWMTREENANYGTIGERIGKRMADNNPMKRPDVAAKVADKQRENGKKRYAEHPELFDSFMNSDKHYEKIKKKVNQYNKITGEFIKTWDSAADVEEELGICHSNVSAACKGKIKSAGGFKWKYYVN